MFGICDVQITSMCNDRFYELPSTLFLGNLKLSTALTTTITFQDSADSLTTAKTSYNHLLPVPFIVDLRVGSPADYL